MSTELSFFRADGDLLVPTEMAQSMWADNHLHGVAVSGALARCGEQAVRAAASWSARARPSTSSGPRPWTPAC